MFELFWQMTGFLAEHKKFAFLCLVAGILLWLVNYTFQPANDEIRASFRKMFSRYLRPAKHGRHSVPVIPDWYNQNWREANGLGEYAGIREHLYANAGVLDDRTILFPRRPVLSHRASK